MKAEKNTELELAQRLIETTGTHLFLTGKAGTGKTTFLRRLKEKGSKRMVVLAPTGIAAINAGGVTIHSFFQLPFAPYLPGSSFSADGKAAYRFRFGKEKVNIIRSMDLLVIDEISMVRADLLDAVDDVMRRYRDRYKPFGGVQLLMIGDLQQLAPVVKEEEWMMLGKYYDTPYFFSSTALKKTEYCTIELQKVYRQSDAGFLSLLNSIRENRMTDDMLATLNSRYIPQFRPKKEDGYIRLVTHNHTARQINARELSALPEQPFTFNATIEGNFPEYSYPTDQQLELKRGAQVMFVKNDSSGEHHYCNGTIGEVTAISDKNIDVRCNDSGEVISVKREEWANTRYILDSESKEIREEIEGIFTQYPLKTAWAITIHKSQGLTFEHAIIDTHEAFAHGQTYVALSRCKTLEGLVLGMPLSRKSIINDSTVEEFTRQALKSMPDGTQLGIMQRKFYIDTLSSLFDFTQISTALKRLTRVIDEHLYRLYPKQLTAIKTEGIRFSESISDVAARFSLQYTRLAETSGNYDSDTTIQQRINAGAAYFNTQLEPTATLLGKMSLDTDNKDVRKKLKDAMEELKTQLYIKTELLSYVTDNGFSTSDFMKKKALLSINNSDKKATHKTKTSKNEKAADGKQQPKTLVADDIERPGLYKKLVAWRNSEASRLGIPVYMVIQQKALLGICRHLPKSTEALCSIPYMGNKGVEKYGDKILELVREETGNGQ